MTTEQIDLLNKIQCGIDKFNQENQYLITNNLNERTIYPYLAQCIKNELEETLYADYVYDIEYNRGCNLNDAAIKTLDGNNISIDIVFHKRGHNEIVGYDNLICIEIKKDSNQEGYIDDENRLSKLTNRKYKFNYMIGIMISITNKLEIKSVFFFN